MVTKRYLVALSVLFFVGLTNADEMINMTTGEVWNTVWNRGHLGGEFGAGYYGYDWPGDSVTHNYYLWNSYFHIGVKINDTAYVTSSEYHFF